MNYCLNGENRIKLGSLHKTGFFTCFFTFLFFLKIHFSSSSVVSVHVSGVWILTFVRAPLLVQSRRSLRVYGPVYLWMAFWWLVAFLLYNVTGLSQPEVVVYHWCLDSFLHICIFKPLVSHYWVTAFNTKAQANIRESSCSWTQRWTGAPENDSSRDPGKGGESTALVEQQSRKPWGKFLENNCLLNISLKISWL